MIATSQVLGTVRHPDGRASGAVDGLVVRENGLLVVITLAQAVLLASQGQLQATVPGSKVTTQVEAVGQEGSEPRLRLLDASGQDDLGSLPIWDRDRACWVNPFRPDGPRLPGPMVGL